MSIASEYFQRQDSYKHPLIVKLNQLQSKRSSKRPVVRVTRERDIMGFQPAKIQLCLVDANGKNPRISDTADWDQDLDHALIVEGIRAIDESNEILRFSLVLKSRLQATLNRHGDGYFNATLVNHILQGPFGEYDRVKDVLQHVYRSPVNPSRTYKDCTSMIDSEIRQCAMELLHNLKYELPQAEDILANALSLYLDERFSVTSRKQLGFL